jgi:hypothetical protein
MFMSETLQLLRTTLALVFCGDRLVKVVQRRQLFLVNKIELQ